MLGRIGPDTPFMHPEGPVDRYGLRNIKDIEFADSKAWPELQAADVLAGAVKRMINIVLKQRCSGTGSPRSPSTLPTTANSSSIWPTAPVGVVQNQPTNLERRISRAVAQIFGRGATLITADLVSVQKTWVASTATRPGAPILATLAGAPPASGTSTISPPAVK